MGFKVFVLAEVTKSALGKNEDSGLSQGTLEGASTESTEEGENSASLMCLESKRQRSSKKGVIRCVKCCQEVR